MSEPHSVVVTGVGVVAASGLGLPMLTDALTQERCCLTNENGALPVNKTGRVRNQIEPSDDFKDDRKALLALNATAQALRCADLPCESPDERRGVYLGTGLSSVTPGELEEDVYPHLLNGRFDREAMARDLAADRASPNRHRPHRLTQEIARRTRSLGGCATNFSACAASAMAIAAGMRSVARGELEVALVGGHDSMIHPMGLLSFIMLGALSPNTCRPFDRHRDGFTLGEGAAVLVLETEQNAKARGVKILAHVRGAGSSVDAHNVTAPHPEGRGAESSMRRALADAQLNPTDIDYINAHGTGTPLGDDAEYQAVRRVFGTNTAISSIKGALGHTIAAAGAVEAAACIAALNGGWIPGTQGLKNPAFDMDFVTQPRADMPKNILSNSFGFGGQNCSLVFGRGDSQ